jgi:hypothetical protein
MPGPISQRLLSVLQLTRMALVFTAISNSMCSVLLLSQWRAMEAGNSYIDHLQPWRMVAVVCVSIGLYGFGMSLNDIIDRRRDRQTAAHRPLPSGRIGVMTAHTINALLLLLAFGGAAYYAHTSTYDGGMTLMLLLWTAMLIVFYDFAGKYLVALGLCSLGLIRFFHAVIPAPQLPMVWHPLLLMNHTAILSAYCYQLEAKRPPLTRAHWMGVIGGLLTANLVCLAGVWWKHTHRFEIETLLESLRIDSRLIYPALAVLGFLAVAWFVRRKNYDPRIAGQTLMLLGLLWLIVYDVTFVAAYVAPLPAALLLLLLPAAYLSVQFMRWWSKVISLSQKPTFQRAR